MQMILVEFNHPYFEGKGFTHIYIKVWKDH